MVLHIRVCFQSPIRFPEETENSGGERDSLRQGQRASPGAARCADQGGPLRAAMPRSRVHSQVSMGSAVFQASKRERFFSDHVEDFSTESMRITQGMPICLGFLCPSMPLPTLLNGLCV